MKQRRFQYARNNYVVLKGHARQPRLGPHCCLLALFALLLLPLVHRCQIHALEGLLTVTNPGFQVQIKIEPTEPKTPDHHHHDEATCPICQAAMSSRYVALPAGAPTLNLQMLVQPIHQVDRAGGIRSPHILVSDSRAPPIFL